MDQAERIANIHAVMQLIQRHKQADDFSEMLEQFEYRNAIRVEKIARGRSEVNSDKGLNRCDKAGFKFSFCKAKKSTLTCFF